MPARTIIRRVINALKLQHRVILHLECGHNDSVNELNFIFAEEPLHFEAGDEYTCPYCPDPSPAVEEPRADANVRAEFDALFKEES